MEELIKILSGLHPDVDFQTHENLIGDKILDSFDIVTLIAEIDDEFDVEVKTEDIVPENFNSAKAIYSMIERLLDED